MSSQNSSISQSESSLSNNPIIKSILDGQNVFISGTGGTGKSYLLQKIADFLETNHKFHPVITSTTGVSAFNINGITIHSWIGATLPSSQPQNLEKWLKQVIDSKNVLNQRESHQSTTLLIIDEISMLGASFLDLIDFILRYNRKCEKTFGGLQVLASGDMLQLPPVNDAWPFESEVWKDLNFKTYILTTRHRFDDKNYADLLDRVRTGEITDDDIILLNSRFNTPYPPTVKPTQIFSLRVDVDNINSRECDKISGKYQTFKSDFYKYSLLSKDKIKVEQPKHVKFPIPSELRLKPGAQVMVIKNLDVEGGIVNGSRAIYKRQQISAEGVMMVVELVNGKEIELRRETFEVEETDGTYICLQYPVILAFATTTHKCQGSTLDCAVIDIGASVFSAGQAYVALSRVKSLKGLYLMQPVRKNRIYSHPKALAFQRQIEKEGQHLNEY
jgi:ATP-dependent DNA helicase PIF1